MMENSTLPLTSPSRKLSFYKWGIGIAMVILICCVSILGVDYYQASRPELFTLPEGYVGPVLIIWDQPNGIPPRYEEGVQIFEIPANGLLLTQASRPYGGIGDDFWYRNELGQRTEKLVFNLNCVTPVPDDPIIVCVLAELMILNGKHTPRHFIAVVGPQSQQHELAQGYYDWRLDILLPMLPP